MTQTFLAQRAHRPSVGAWWATAAREGFTALCSQQRQDHMIDSFGDKHVSGSVVVGYLEGAKKQKGAR